MSGRTSQLILATLCLALNTTLTCAATPAIPTGLVFGVTALALKPGASNLNYVIFNKALPLQSPSWTERELRPAYSAAFGLDAGYIFATGRDIKLDWTHLMSSTSASVAADGVDYFLGPDFEIDPDAIPIRYASGNVKFRYDVVNLAVGQFIDVGQHVQMRFFGGLSTGFLREEVNTTFSGNVPTGTYAGPFNSNQDIVSNFTGIGPLAGIEANYHMNNGFGFMGEAAFSALIGSMYSKTDYVTTSQELIDKYGQTLNSQSIKDMNVTQVIPGFGGKLGITFQHTFKKNALFTLEAGYTASVYINAINQYLPGSLVSGETIDTGGIFVATMNHTQSNYSVQGPFLRAALQFS